MQQIQSFREKEPVIQILIVFGLMLLGMIILSLFSAFLGMFIFGTDMQKIANLLSGADPTYVWLTKLLLVIQQVFFFLLPAIGLATLEKTSINKFYGLNPPKPYLLLIVFAIIVCGMPLISLMGEINQKMVLPDFLKNLEQTMKNLEKAAGKTTELILGTTSITGVFINLLVIAVTPAICEELFFRGALQRTMVRMFKNPHVGIWLSAIIFSAIHLQFYGFLPRMFLGALFGYIYFWTGSLRYTMFAHFLNNGYAVVVAYYLQKNNIDMAKADEVNIAWYGYVISAGITLALFTLLYKKTAQQEIA